MKRDIFSISSFLRSSISSLPQFSFFIIFFTTAKRLSL